MNFKNDIPIYIQISTDIQEQIVSGILADGQKLPSVREFSAKYDVSALTMQRTIQYMETLGIVRTQKGVGSFVTDGCADRIRKHMINQEVKEFVERMRKRGLTDKEIRSAIEEEMTHE